MRIDGNQGKRPNYNPNTISPLINQQHMATSMFPVSGMVQRYVPSHPNSDFEQPGNLFRKVMSATDRDHLITNISGHLKGARREVQERQVKIFQKCDSEYGDRIAKNLGFPVTKSRL